MIKYKYIVGFVCTILTSCYSPSYDESSPSSNSKENKNDINNVYDINDDEDKNGSFCFEENINKYICSFDSYPYDKEEIKNNSKINPYDKNKFINLKIDVKQKPF